MSKRIRVTPYAGIGNRMFQYMLALALQHHVPEARIYGVRLPEWGIEMPTTPPQSGPSVTLKHHNVPFSQVVRTMLSVDRIDINLTRLQCRMEYYQDLLPTYRRTFPAAPQQGGGDSELVFHVRAGDILSGSHKTYMPAPLGFFEMLLRTTGLAPVFVGQIGDDRYSEALRRRFPEARFIRHQDPLKDFHVLRNSTHIVPSVGTFGWLACWLSERARAIYVPVMGLLHPGARPEIDLLPRNDARFVFYRSNLLAWDGSAVDLDAIIEAPASAFGFRRASTVPRLRLAIRHAPRELYLSLLRRRRVANRLARIRRAARVGAA